MAGLKIPVVQIGQDYRPNITRGVPDVPNLAGVLSGGFNSLTNDVQQIADQLHRTQIKNDQIKVIQGETSTVASTDAAISKLDPLDKDYLSKVQGVYDDAKKNASANADLSTREGQEALEGRMSVIAASGMRQAQQMQRRSIDQEAIRTVNTSSNEMFAKIRRDPDGAATYQSGFQADYDRLTDGMNPDTKRQLGEQIKDQVVVSQSLGYADRGNYAAAKKTLDDNMGSLNPGQEQKARYQIEATENKARADSARYAANQAADVMVKIEDWKTNPDPTAPPPYSRADLEKMRGAFGNNPSAFLGMVTHLDNAIRGRQVAMQATTEALSNAQTHSLRSQEQADLAFNNQYALAGKKPAEVLTPDLVQAAGIFARDQGYIPSAYKAVIENAGRMGGSNTPEDQQRLAAATAAYDKINELAPNAKWNFADDKNSRVQLASTMAKENQISVEEASRRVLNLTPKTENELQQRDLSFKQAFQDAHGQGTGRNEQQWLKDTVTSAFKNFGQSITGAIGITDKTPDVPPEVGADYKKQLEKNYQAVPDWNTAKKATDAWLAQNYSVTHVGDRNEVTKYAPEKYFDPSVVDRVNKYGLGDTIINEDVNSILKSNSIVPGRSPYDPNMPGWRLYADDQTAREADKFGPNGGQVTYKIQVLNAAGDTYVDVNGPRYRLPNAQEIINQSDFILKEAASKDINIQSQEAQKARSILTPPNRATGARPTLSLPNLNLQKSDTGIEGPKPAQAPNLDEILQKRAMDRYGNIP